MAIATETHNQSMLKMRAGIGLASMFVVGCFCVAILVSGTQTQAADDPAPPRHLAETNAAG